jgi:hypothetical protein
MRQELTALWSRSKASKEQLVKQLEDCAGAPRKAASARCESWPLRRYDSLLADRG